MSDITIVGYSVDSVIEAVCQASSHDKVTFIASGELGAPMDLFHDVISERYAEMIEVFLGGEFEYDTIHDPRHMYIPYDKVSITNKTNGIIQLPLNKNSFVEDEWNEICTAYTTDKNIVDCFTNKSLSPSKFLSSLKSGMPKNFVDTFGKLLGVTRWRGIQLSHLTMNGYCYEYSFDHLTEDYHEVYCRPKMSYNAICKLLIDKYGINLVQGDDDSIREVIFQKNYPGEVVIMDNRVDQYMNYMGGRFDRECMKISPINLPMQLVGASNGLYLTPLNDFWGVLVDDDNAYKLSSELVHTLFDKSISEIPVTRNNVKTYKQYCDILALYGKKRLDLAQRIETLVK